MLHVDRIYIGIYVCMDVWIQRIRIICIVLCERELSGTFMIHKSRKGLLNGVSDRILFPFQICFRLYLYRSFFALISMTFILLYVCFKHNNITFNLNKLGTVMPSL